MKHYLFMGLVFFFCTSSAAFSNQLTVRVPMEAYPPFFIKTEAGQWRGLSIELAEALLGEAGVKPVYTSLPFKRALKYLEVGSLDMMLNLITQMHGRPLAAMVSEELICDRIRGRNDRQRIPLRLHLGTGQPKLEEAVALMEANLEEPMSLDELAGHVQLSRRQLERLFRKHLGCVPTRYYLELRLARARQLLLQTNLSIVDVAFACGFVSAPHFSKCYRDHFQIPPRDERRLQHAPETDGQATG